MSPLTGDSDALLPTVQAEGWLPEVLTDTACAGAEHQLRVLWGSQCEQQALAASKLRAQVMSQSPAKMTQLCVV